MILLWNLVEILRLVQFTLTFILWLILIFLIFCYSSRHQKVVMALLVWNRTPLRGRVIEFVNSNINQRSHCFFFNNAFWLNLLWKFYLFPLIHALVTEESKIFLVLTKNFVASAHRDGLHLRGQNERLLVSFGKGLLVMNSELNASLQQSRKVGHHFLDVF